MRKRGRAITLAKSFPKSRNRLNSLNLSASSARRFGRGFRLRDFASSTATRHSSFSNISHVHLLRICLGQASRNRRSVLFDCAHNERNEINIYLLSVSGMLLWVNFHPSININFAIMYS